MNALKRAPSKAETALAVAFMLTATALLGWFSAFLWFDDRPHSFPAAILFTALFLASAVLLVRAAFTTRRALSQRQSIGVAWAMIAVGACGAFASLLFMHSPGRFGLLAPSLSCLMYGLAGLKHRGR